MGISKIRQRGPQYDKNQKQIPKPPANPHAENNLDYDSDEHEVAVVGCELALLGGQICNIPYELYTLPDLKEILSLETWNLCLTEEERFSLTAYLPDLDQEMFWLTVKELLSGENMFFGNPLDTLFQRLKGGLYSPRVAHFMEAMQLLQKRKFYHSLKSYHETLNKRFEDMRISWSNLQPSVAAQERIKIWNSKQQRPVLLVDLNAIPTDDDVPTSSFDGNMLNRQVFSGTFPSLSLNKNMKAKGVLKIKPVNMSFVENQTVQLSVSDTIEVHRRPPKGVLKIKGKSNQLSQAETSYDLLQSPMSRITPPQFATQWHHQDNNINGLPYMHQSFRDGRYSELPDLNSHHRGSFLTTGMSVVRNAQSSKTKMSLSKEMRLHSIPESQGEILPVTTFEMLAGETGKFREYRSSENPRPNLDPSSSVPSGSSLESYSFPLKSDRRRGNAKFSKAKLETTIGDSILHTRLGSPLQLDEKDGDRIIGGEKPSDNYTVSDVQRDNPMFPLTYKRKKPFTKLNPMVTNKKLAKDACSEENISGSDSHVPQKSGGLKIRFKPLNDNNAHYKQGMLNELQLGSSSTRGI